MSLYKKGDFIIDVDECRVLSQNSSATFDFDDMTMYIKNAKSQKRPIKYNGANVLYWKSQNWNTWPRAQQEAINALFHDYTDREILR